MRKVFLNEICVFVNGCSFAFIVNESGKHMSLLPRYLKI